MGIFVPPFQGFLMPPAPGVGYGDLYGNFFLGPVAGGLSVPDSFHPRPESPLYAHAFAGMSGSPLHRPKATSILKTASEGDVVPGISFAKLYAGMSQIGVKIKLKAGDTLFSRGDAAHALYWIQEGSLLVHLSDRQIELGPDNVVGEIGVIEERGIRTATVTAKTDVVLLEMTDDQFRAFVTQHTQKSLQALARDRKEVWPSVLVQDQPVRLINIDEPYLPLVAKILGDERTRNKILELAGIPAGDPSQKIIIEDAQFGGQGTIKYVVRLGVRVNGEMVSLGLRFYRSQPFRGAVGRAHQAAMEEMELMQSFARIGTAIDIFDYFSADAWFGKTDILFSAAGVAGFSVGEYVVSPSAEFLGDTGVRAQHLTDIIATLVRAWRRLKKGETGPVMSDLRFKNFVDAHLQRRGEPIKCIDLGAVMWVRLAELYDHLKDFVDQKMPSHSETERKRVLKEGFYRGDLALTGLQRPH